MTDNLLQFKKASDIMPAQVSATFHSEVNVVKKFNGIIEHVDYYTNDGELLKQVFYDGSSISTVKHYRNGSLYQEEHYSDGKVVSKGTFDKSGKQVAGVAYQYNRRNKIVNIKKSSFDNTYSVEYGYDELDRVNSRKICFNLKQILEQKYRYDILDRVVEYKDDNQSITVTKISPRHELISYEIIDKIGNVFSIVNNFDGGHYKNTDITLNGHKVTKINRSYMDNVMLKKPYTTEEDLDLIIANLFSSQQSVTKRVRSNDISENIINNKVENRVLPISMRKRLLYSQAVNM